MIYSEKINQDNGIKAIVHWKYEEKEHTVENLFQDQDLAVCFITNVARKLFIEKVTKYVKQKTWLFNNNLDFQHSIAKANAITKINQLIQILPGLTLNGVCTSILMYKKELLEVMPGPMSKYYEHDTAVIHGIIEDCEKIITNQKISIAS